LKKTYIVSLTLALALILVTSFQFVSLGQSEGPENSNPAVSYPRYGFGAQFISPSGGLSSRIWLNSSFGFEGNAIVWSSPYANIDGTTSLRLLYKLTGDSRVDFYVTGGGAYNFGSSSDSGQFAGVGTGGISVEAFSKNFVLNLEFGMQVQSAQRFGMTFGSGFHYYF
jgi:hypothetical protein